MAYPLTAAAPVLSTLEARGYITYFPWLAACVAWSVACLSIGALLSFAFISPVNTRYDVSAADSISTSVPCMVQIAVPLLVHLQNIGDRRYDGSAGSFAAGFAGTRGESRRLEGFAVLIDVPTTPLPTGISIRYSVHLVGRRQDEAVVSMGAFAGTRGQSQALGGFTAWLEGPHATLWQLKYYAHVQNMGDTPVCSGGEYCGTRHSDLRMEGMYMWLERRCEPL